RRDSVTEWIDLGRSLQRFLLKATAFGIAHAYINQPCEIAGLANDLATKIPIDNEYPTIALRLGYAEKTPYSLRKNVETLISYQ
ncbi:MAG: hypothetical protein LBO72_10070, partial [Helicobacteraceae bacterium]|nr:hypothetical protein [Helicobacteraceae bacterium]